MWDIYDRLISGIPDDITVKSAVCGLVWTAVTTSDGGVGLAMTTDVHTLPAEIYDFTGLPLKAAAERVKSWNFTEAGIGMAAINAYYNSPKRMEALNAAQPDDRFCSFDIPLKGKNVTLVGAIRSPEHIFDDAARLIIMERSIVKGTDPDSACEYYLPDSDVVIITGSAFVNKTMPRLIELSRHADVIITGPSTPMADILFDYGVRRLTGLSVTDTAGCIAHACSGKNSSPYRYGRRFAIER